MKGDTLPASHPWTEPECDWAARVADAVDALCRASLQCSASLSRTSIDGIYEAARHAKRLKRSHVPGLLAFHAGRVAMAGEEASRHDRSLVCLVVALRAEIRSMPAKDNAPGVSCRPEDAGSRDLPAHHAELRQAARDQPRDQAPPQKGFGPTPRR